MTRDILFLLKHDFPDGPGALWYCHECAQIEGALHYHPQLRYHLDVRHVDYPRPRTEIASLIGAENQSCPVLILGRPAPENPQGFTLGTVNGRQFVSGADEIGHYLSQVYGVGRPH